MADAKGEASAIGSKPLPRVQLPLESTLSKLSARDLEQIQRLLSEPFEFISHQSFNKPGAADECFGDPQRGFSVAAWCNAAPARKRKVSDTGSNAPTLSGDQERKLFLAFNYARYRIQQVFDQFDSKRLTTAAIEEILTWHRRSEEAKCLLVQANVPLVLAMAKRTRLGNIDYAELISEGNMALLRSVDKFDCARGFKFSTYACRAILKSFSRVAMKIGRYRGRFPVEFDPTLEKSDFLETQRLDHEAECVSELRGIMEENTAELNDVETKVLTARFALGIGPYAAAGEPQTLEQVGLLIGVTKERVRQIQNRALAKLREKLQKDFLAA